MADELDAFFKQGGLDIDEMEQKKFEKPLA
jgi:hypothetical protein